jgi:NAD-dependent DNA ligase
MSTEQNPWLRQAVYYRNEFKQSAGQLIGIATGLIADGVLTDAEIAYLHHWLTVHDEVAFEWPGNILCARVKAALADGVITESERAYLLATLRDLVGEQPDTVEAATHVTELAFDEVQTIRFAGSVFCLTGNFVYAPKSDCEIAIVRRDGIIKHSVSKKLHYLVVGSLGSQEWKHGSFGTKIERAMELKQEGASILIVREDVWATALSVTPAPPGTAAAV